MAGLFAKGNNSWLGGTASRASHGGGPDGRLARAQLHGIGGRQRRYPHGHFLQFPHQRVRLVHLYGQRGLRSGDAGQAQLVPSRLAHQRADEDGPAPLRHHLGGLSRIRFATADRRPLRLSFAADQRHAAPALASGRRAFSAHGRPRDRCAFRRRRNGAHSRHRHAHGGGRRRLLPDRRDALGSYR